MLKIVRPPVNSQHLQSAEQRDESVILVPRIDCTLPFSDYFYAAVEDNSSYLASREKTRRYTSPMFRLVQHLRAYPRLQRCSADEAFSLVASEVNPEWDKLFPNILPDLEFTIAWEQIKLPAGKRPLEVVEQLVRDAPLKLRHRGCRGYDIYLSIAFHLQSLMPRSDILLPVATVSEMLTRLLGLRIGMSHVSYYSSLAKKGGYLSLTKSAHSPSGKAAQYRFSLTRFNSAGVELDGIGIEEYRVCNHGVYGTQGKHGVEGMEDSLGIQGNGGEKEVNSPASPTKSYTREEEKMQPGETADNGTPLSSPIPIAEGWMNEGKPLPKQLIPVSNDPELNALFSGELKQQTVPLSIPTSAKAGILSAFWKARQDELEPKMYHRPLTQQEMGMMAGFGRLTGNDRAGQVIDCVLRRWYVFVEKARINEGAYPLPQEPNVTFLLKYRQTAINMALAELQSVATKPVIKPFPLPQPVVKTVVETVVEKEKPATLEEMKKIFAGEL